MNSAMRIRHYRALGWNGSSDGGQRSQISKAKPESRRQPAQVQGLVRDFAHPIQNKKATSTAFNVECALQCARK
jgi:hypothetical protein